MCGRSLPVLRQKAKDQGQLGKDPQFLRGQWFSPSCLWTLAPLVNLPRLERRESCEGVPVAPSIREWDVTKACGDFVATGGSTVSVRCANNLKINGAADPHCPDISSTYFPAWEA
jgi:hypothetical protein